MTDSDWNDLRRLSLTGHNWGEPYLIDKKIVQLLDLVLYTESLNATVTSGACGTHSAGSYHYATENRLCVALDLMFHGKRLYDIPNLALTFLRYPFTGLGVYSGWEDADGVKGGIHVDLRPKKRRALWLHNGNDYLGFNMENLNHYFRPQL